MALLDGIGMAIKPCGAANLENALFGFTR